MSIASYILQDLLDEPFGMGMLPWDIFTTGYHPRPDHRHAYRRQHSDNPSDHRKRQPQIESNGFQAHFDVSHFVPNEITVKTVENMVVV